MTPAELERVARQYLDPANTAIFVVGDLEAIEPEVRALALGEIKVLAKADVLGPIPIIE